MKAQELRIGNWVKWVFPNRNNQPNKIKDCQVQSIGGLVGILDSAYGYDQIEPIPLTEQWLNDFGVLQDPNYKCFYIKGMEFDIPTMSGGYHDNEYGLDEENRITLFYVHQLQNLYFALTGEELQL